MEIIIEGCDGVGKTTLVNKLKKHYNIDSMHITSKDPNNYKFYKQLLLKKQVVYDRHFIGEMIYPSIFDRKQKLNNKQFKKLLACCNKNKVKILILTTDVDTILERLNERGNEHEKIIDNIEIINSLFLRYSQMYNIKVIDTTKINMRELYHWLEE